MIFRDLATWRGPTPNRGTGGAQQYGMVVHIAEGSYDGTISWQLNPTADVSSYFINARDGRRAQMVDTADKAWTQAQGNTHWRGVENEGFHGTPLTDAQVESCALEFAALAAADGFPIRLCTMDPRLVTRPQDGGLTYHAAGGTEWGGHFDCPSDPIIAQLPLIVARAKQIAGGIMTTPEQDADAVWHRDIGPEPGSQEAWTMLAGYRARFTALDQAVAAVAAKLDSAEQVALTDAQVAQITTGLAAELGAELAELSAQLGRVIAALTAAGRALDA